MLNFFFLSNKNYFVIKAGFAADYVVKYFTSNFIKGFLIDFSLFFLEKYLIEYLSRSIVSKVNFKKLYSLPNQATLNFIYIYIGLVTLTYTVI